MQTFSAPPDVRAFLAAGLDPDRIPWDLIVAVAKWFASLFATAQSFQAAGTQITPATLKAAHPDCPDAVCECCCANICLAMQIVANSLDCCATCKV